MTPVTSFKGKRVALFGLGGSGLSTARALVAGGAQVAAWDDGEAARERPSPQGLALDDLAGADWRGFAALVLSPGVPLTHPEPHWTVAGARKRRASRSSATSSFSAASARRSRRGAPFVAITGTNGKSTTTALIAHILREAGRDVQLGGNIGTPILALAPPSDERIHVIECSSFQIDLAPSLAPTVGILLNVTPDHLDRHGTMENYAAIKERLVARAECRARRRRRRLLPCHRRAACARRHAASSGSVPVSATRALDWGFYRRRAKRLFRASRAIRRKRRSRSARFRRAGAARRA